MTCEICGADQLTDLYPMEMMHGKEGPFHYVRCLACESVYQPNRLSDYGRYYPNSYYSFQYQEPRTLSARLRQIKRRWRNRYYYFAEGLIGRLLARARPCPTNHLSRHVRLRHDMAILEIGCGTGELLHEIADLGIRRVVGIDPFVPNDIAYKNGARVLKAAISDLPQRLGEEKFDLIMFNHALEHSPTPLEDLSRATRFLRPDGEILIRVPLPGSEIARQYGIHWWSLDAPRHIYLFSVKGMALIADRCGLRVKRIHYEGTIDDYLASEQHKAGIALLSERSYVVTHDLSVVGAQRLAVYQAAIDRQNSDGTAAQAGFILGFK